MKKWRNKALSVLLVCVMLVSGLGFAAAAPQPAEAAGVSGQTIVNTARQYIGKVPYVYGGTKIDGTNPGADCSGFICRIYEKHGINMWSVRTHLRDYGTNIGTDLDQAKVGDIIWFDGHVAIYSGKQGSKHMIIHETGGSFQNVVETSTSVVKATLRGIIRIPGVNSNGTTADVSQVTFSAATDPDYTAKESISDTNAVLVSRIAKPAGVHVSQMGIDIYRGDRVIKSYNEAVSVGDSTTVYHSWYDVNKELGLTLEAGTTYGYKFFGVFDGVKVSGPRMTFTTTGTPSSYYSVTFYGNESKTTSYQNWARYGETLEEVFEGALPTANKKDGYVFDHWYVIENGQEVPIDAGTYFRWTQEVKVYPAYVEAVSEDDPDIILPPPDSTSDEETHHVTFMDLTNMTTYADYDIENGAAFTLPTRTPSREGYTFVGWFTSASGGTEITAQTICDLDDDATFYARFEKIAAEPEDPSDEPQPGSVDMTLTIGSPMLTINGERTFIDSLGTTPIIRDGRTLLPVRAVIEGMGGTVEWDGGTRMVTLWVDGHSLRLTLDSRMVQDGRNDWYYLDVAPVSIGGRTMLPIRFIVEYFGGQVVWNGDSRSVTITY